MLPTRAVLPPVLSGPNPLRVFMSSNLCTCSSCCLESFSPPLGHLIFHASQPNSNAIISGKQALFPSVPSSSVLSYLAVIVFALCLRRLSSQILSASTAGAGCEQVTRSRPQSSARSTGGVGKRLPLRIRSGRRGVKEHWPRRPRLRSAPTGTGEAAPEAPTSSPSCYPWQQ